jgi:hypothetical protein
MTQLHCSDAIDSVVRRNKVIISSADNDLQKGSVMVDLSIWHAGGRQHSGGALRLIADFFALMGAAVRAARAVEARRKPQPSDLAILGIDKELPRGW